MKHAGLEIVQNHLAIALRNRTESIPGNPPHFFIGCSPSDTKKVLHPDPEYRASGVMLSINALRDRKSDFEVTDNYPWMLDSGAFTEVSRNGGYRFGVEEYYWQICRWSRCGNLFIAVAQDWMCEPFVLDRTGLTVAEHQRLTIERYDQLLKFDPPVPIMPVLQGYQSSDYLEHLQNYGDRFFPGQWVGVGSVCRRNGNPDEVANILKTVKLLRPDLKLHGFGLKAIAMSSPEIRSLLFSFDSMAWSYPLKFCRGGDSVQNHLRSSGDIVQKQNPVDLAWNYQEKIASRLAGTYQKTVPRTAGAGNGQGRKPKYRAGKTVAIRVPEVFKSRVLATVDKWDEAYEKGD